MDKEKIPVHRFPMPGINSNMYIIIEDNEAFIVDPNINGNALGLLKENGVQSAAVVITHEHYDHISGVNWLRESIDCTVMCSRDAADAVTDSSRNFAKFWDVLMMGKTPEEIKTGLKVKDENYTCRADEILQNEKEWQWKGHSVRVRAAPGHSKGGILISFDNILFSGDNLVNGFGVICRLPGGKWKIYETETLPLIQRMSDDVMVYPGHGEPDKLGNLRKYLVKFGQEVGDGK
ncbi:MAG: MBL fold metallo-hydrolase [Schwartzia succinivorans]|uniref:MBL fold metallo-hydrolase n=1 Tax=Schwartzia succinivorans TaxID=55507 RepID=UPI0023542F2D|nr:MBL fold metallo-hydrolase [Schwartzia succinivorans]MBE6096543.1 MBL fold metallo-hydrolase [Schwartzia succinivorans]